jgi:hypothetical protein
MQLRRPAAQNANGDFLNDDNDDNGGDGGADARYDQDSLLQLLRLLDDADVDDDGNNSGGDNDDNDNNTRNSGGGVGVAAADTGILSLPRAPSSAVLRQLRPVVVDCGDAPHVTTTHTKTMTTSMSMPMPTTKMIKTTATAMKTTKKTSSTTVVAVAATKFVYIAAYTSALRFAFLRWRANARLRARLRKMHVSALCQWRRRRIGAAFTAWRKSAAPVVVCMVSDRV